MVFRIGDFVPNFWQDSSQGLLNLYNYANGRWVVLFSYPNDFTAESAAEICSAAGLAPDFARCGARLLGLSADRAEDHRAWLKELEGRRALRVEFPLVADCDRKVSALYGLIDPGSAAQLPVRRLLIISPNKRLCLAQSALAVAPREFGPVLRVLESMQRPPHRLDAPPRAAEHDAMIVPREPAETA